jgi:hypothetical protein
MQRAPILVLVVAIALTPIMSAQQHSDQPEVPINLSVVDPSGAAVADACVTVAQHAQAVHFTEETDANGKLAVMLTAGSYDFTVTASGFAKTVGHLEVASNSTSSLEIKMPVGACSGGCGPEVTSAAPLRAANNQPSTPASPKATGKNCAGLCCGSKPSVAGGQRDEYSIPISIRIVDMSKAPVPGARVTVEATTQLLKFSQETNPRGSLPLVLSPGEYEIRAAAIGFGKTVTPLEVTRNSPSCIQIELPYYTCSNCAEVSVTSHDEHQVKRIAYTQCASSAK